jgi:hypothetical protein
VVIYRSTREIVHQFLSNFSAFLEHIADSSGHLLIVRYFNIHVDVSSDPLVKKFNSILKMHSLRQHVLFPTHVGGHILDLVLSREADNFIADCFVKGVISDHIWLSTMFLMLTVLSGQNESSLLGD